MSNCSASHKKSTKSELFYERTFEIDIETQTISLFKHSLSPSEVSRHFCDVGIPGVTPYRVKKILLDHAPNIEHINKKFDEIASKCISILEWDETFKGMKYKVLVVMDSITGYVYMVDRIPERSYDEIKAALKPLESILRKVQVVLTDGATYFPKVVEDLCPNAEHQICLVHVMRGVHADLRKIKKPYGDALSKVKKIRDHLKSAKNSLEEKRMNKKKKGQKLRYHKGKREKLRKKHKVKPYQKGIWEKFPELKKNYEIINKTQSELRSVSLSVENGVQRIKSLKEKLKEAKKNMHSEWAKYMKECKIKTEFYNLFLHRQEEYERKKNAFIEKLQAGPSNDMHDRMLRLLKEVPGLDAINRADAKHPLKRNFINTNGIESFNSKFRELLESMRNVFDSPYCRTRIQLFRLHHNADRPHHGSRDQLAPIERYGYNLRGRNSVTLVIDGLPPGPQPNLFLPKLNADLTARKLSKPAIFSQS